MYTNDNNKSIFPKGYPKRIFLKHTVPQKIYKDKFNNIIGVHPSVIAFWKNVFSPVEENRLLNKYDVSCEIISAPTLVRSNSNRYL